MKENIDNDEKMMPFRVHENNNNDNTLNIRNAIFAVLLSELCNGYVQNVFKHFFSKHKYKNSGLGLSAVLTATDQKPRNY